MLFQSINTDHQWSKISSYEMQMCIQGMINHYHLNYIHYYPTSNEYEVSFKNVKTQKPYIMWLKNPTNDFARWIIRQPNYHTINEI
jgi:hypothetical protein